MSFETITVQRDCTTAVITLNRPERCNAVSIAMMEELLDAAHTAEQEDAVRAVIITGGQDFFSAGADLTEAVGIEGARDGFEYFGRWHRLTQRLEALAKPVVAAIEGFCLTGGCELALACDLRVAGDGASFAITSSRIGTIAGAGGTQRLPRLVGMGNALDMLFSAEPIDADEAYRIGLINRKTVKGDALNEAVRMASIYAERAPLSLALAKRAVRRSMQVDLAVGLELETFLATTIYGTDDKREGISAFLEKRSPEFKGS
jgi:enoyl-CoA hydratase/carnithine racemase